MKLNLPTYFFKIKAIKEKKYIFDTLRKKYIRLTPEEFVRQNLVQFLIQEKKYSPNLIKLETSLEINHTKKRVDILIFDKTGKPILIVECKAPYIEINQNTFEQIATYNMNLKVKYLLLSNGIVHYCCKMNYENQTYQFIKEIPNYLEI